MTQMLFSYCRNEASASSISVPAELVRQRAHLTTDRLAKFAPDRSMMKAPYWPKIISRSAGDHRFGVLMVWI